MANNKHYYALVTGGNRGLGLEVVKQLAALGKPVLIACRDPAKAEAAVKEVEAAAGGSKADVKALPVPMEASNAADVAALAELVGREYAQQIDLLVNNAGMLVRGVWARDAYDQTLATNVNGPVRLSEALLPHLAPDAKIVMVSSGLGQTANLSPDYAAAVAGVATLAALRDASAAVPFIEASKMGTEPPGSGAMTPTYTVSKALLNRAVQLMSSSGPEGAPFAARGVKVYAVCPGWCRTDMGSQDAPRSAEQGAQSILQPFTASDGAVAAGSYTRDGEALEW